ncbi:MAG: MerR family transcriptional regulator, partial [Acidimicrobiales bacterium]
AWEQGQDVAAVLGLEAALSAPWADRPVQFVTVAELVETFGERAMPFLTEAIDLGLLAAEDGGRYRVANPAALEVGRLLVAAGVPLEAVLATARRLRSDVDAIARRFVGLVQTHVVGPPGASLDGVELRGLGELVAALRPLVSRLVDAELGRAMEAEISRRLGEHLERLAQGTRPSRRG